MFFGLKISDNQSDANVTTFSSNVKLSQAVLEPSTKATKNSQPVSLMIEHEGDHFCLGVLTPGQVWQCPLDLLMEADMKVKFYLKGGSGTVHLTGYESPDLDMDDFSSDDDMEDSEEVESSDLSDIEIDDKNRVRALAKVANGKQVSNRATPTKAETSKDGSAKATNGRAARLTKKQVEALNKLGEKIDDGEDDSDSDDEDYDILNPDDDSDASDNEDDEDDSEDDDGEDQDEEMSDEEMDEDSDDEY